MAAATESVEIVGHGDSRNRQRTSCYEKGVISKKRGQATLGGGLAHREPCKHLNSITNYPAYKLLGRAHDTLRCTLAIINRLLK